MASHDLPQASIAALPDFSSMDTATLKQQVNEAIRQAEQQLDNTPAQAIDAASALAHIQQLEHTENQLQLAWGVLSNLNAVMNSPEIRELYQGLLPALSEYYTRLGQHEGLFTHYQLVKSSAVFATLNQAQQRAIDLAIRDFKLSGVDLNPADKQRFAEISARLSELSSRFSNNVLDATQAWSLPLNQAQLAGLPSSAIALLEQLGQQRGHIGALATLDAPALTAILTYADDRQLREALYHAYAIRASALGDSALDNSALMEEILALRAEMAALVGYANYAEYSLASKMAPSVNEVSAFLQQLAEKARQPAQQEISQLQQEAAHYGIEQLQAWDAGYLAEKIKQRDYKLSQEQLKPYFPAPVVIEGLFKIVERLYGIQIQQKHTSTWHPDVNYYEVSEHGTVIAGFYFDLYARSNKRGGAWMSGYRSRVQLANHLQLPVAFMVCNFSPAIGEQPALLTHQELITLFHEFGHGLHHMLTEVDSIHVAGTHGVAWDAVELPSQFMEFWTWDSESLSLISQHYEHQQTLPQELLDALLNARYFQTGMQTLRQVEFSLFDLAIHQQNPAPDSQHIQDILNNIREQTAVLLPPDYNRFQHSFSHIFAGGYAAGYYSYKWAEVLASDAFDRFEQEGIFNPATGAAFRQHILAVGGSIDALSAFKNFRGRDAQLDALFRHNGWPAGHAA